MEKRWVLKDEAAPEVVNNLAEQLHISPTLAAVLCMRGVCTFEEAKAFFRPSLEDLHDPFLMKDMDKAIDRLLTAIHHQEKVLVYGDYDVDGTTSVALVYDFLSAFVPQIDFYIPNRYTEGYGVSTQGIDWASENNFSLIISLDCGIKSVDKVAYAKSKGIDFIICDHHLPDEELPDAVAVLDPKRSDCPYPFKELSGCGVGFKLLQAFCLSQGHDMESLYELLDLVVVSIAADIVPITGENRVLAYFGLRKLNSGAPLRPGLEALKELAGLKEELDISSIVFGFAPRINAAGRMGDAKRSVRMLLAKTKDEAHQMADIINETNKERRTKDTNITKEALEMIEKDELLRNSRSTVLYKDNWHKGVIGIVASRCIEKYYRPTIILTQSNGLATGSARSVHGFNVHSAIHECADLLEQYGGHMYAAGLTLKVENIPAFREKFERIVSSTITSEQLIPQIEIDTKLHLSQVTNKFYNILKQMEPFGPGNMRPVFMSECVYDTGSARVVGDSHLKLKLVQDGAFPVDAIGFGLGEHYNKISKGIPFNVCYTIEENVFRGVISLQLRIKDIRF
ncbi:MAG: single-stranded-DNA-specific exonuclease RecJ [Hymenobacteraceae bacterium]|nr:single-stranded-DNA-specific exonuclease RecJ [Hymenobacteraceae bacterium]MDX5395621.1 single-stranded-DNA-specific exonuclease RecJ [Hymenobacteraceae bacterium]MDX5442802.1 single-stranded-DNA-specific exonuclease RecJ [Hymenobacteraceae bacterium]MDX5511675.1 single-stranded-DNA-specific exonuclease RecJ [Hymenobacteraceae bacterium]